MTVSIDVDRKREENLELQPVLAMFSSQGWRWLETWLKDKRAECEKKLYLPNGVSTIEEVFAHRQRLGLINELLDMPEEKKHTVEMNNRDLMEAQQREEA